MELQTYLFDVLESRYPKRSVLVAALQDLLSVGKDAIYRRMRGETFLTPDEISLLCKTYQISLDGLIHQDTGTVFFDFSAFKNPIRSVDQYLEGLIRNVDQVLSIPDGKIYYASSEVPIFYYAFFPDLLMFKLYVWGQTIWDIDAYKNLPFSIDVMPYHTQALAEELIQKYVANDTIELWSMNVMENTLNQIHYHVEIGNFKDPSEAVKLCDDINQLLEHIHKMAQAESKFLPGQQSPQGHFDLYHNEMIYTNNTIYFSSPHLNMLFATFANPNFLASSDPKVCAYKFNWFKNLISKSSPMSGAAEKSRSRFFLSVNRSVQRTRQKLMAMIE